MDQLPDTLEARYDELIGRLESFAAATGRRLPRGRDGQHTACCPAHNDNHPSLSLKLIDGDKILVHCFAGCGLDAICDAVGFAPEGLFMDYRGNGAGEAPELRLNGRRIARSGPRIHQNRTNGLTPRKETLAFVRSLYEPVERLALPPTIGEFLDLDFPAIDPLLGPIATQQIVMLYAPPGAGKTMLALALAHSMAAGRDFLGWTATRRARVLVIDGEMVGEMMQRRLAHAGLEDDWLRVANLSTWGASSGYEEPINLCTDVGQAMVEFWCNATGAEVLVLDNLMSLAWIDGLSMSSDEFWQPVRRFASRQRALGRTVIIVDHTNAAGEIFGTKTKIWHADLAIQLSVMTETEKEDGLSLVVPKTRFKLQFAKVRDGGVGTSSDLSQSVQEKVVTLGPVGQDWPWVGGRAEQRQKAREMKADGLTIRDIAEELGMSKSQIGRWVKGL